MSLLFGLSRQNSAIVSSMSSDSGFYSLIKKRLACNDTARRSKFRLISYKFVVTFAQAQCAAFCEAALRHPTIADRRQ